MLLGRSRRSDRDRHARRLRLRLLQQFAQPDRCLVCTTELSPEFRCCPGCGLELRRDCEDCGAPVHATWRACPHCGAAAGVRASAA